MKARIYYMLQHSRQDGPGLRMVVCFQGCAQACPECWNPAVREANAGVKMDTEDIKRRMMLDVELEGLTLAGGEPFLQPEAALELAKYAHALGLNVACSTGYRSADIFSNFDDVQRALLNEVDVLTDCCTGRVYDVRALQDGQLSKPKVAIDRLSFRKKRANAEKP